MNLNKMNLIYTGYILAENDSDPSDSDTEFFKKPRMPVADLDDTTR